MGGHQLHHSLPRATLAAPASHPPSCSEMPLLAAASSSSSRSFLPARSWDSSQQASNFAHLAASHLWCQCPCSLPSVRLWHPLSLGVTPWKLPLAGGRQQSAHAAAGTAKGAQSFHSSLDRVVLPGGKAVAVTNTYKPQRISRSRTSAEATLGCGSRAGVCCSIIPALSAQPSPVPGGEQSPLNAGTG